MVSKTGILTNAAINSTIIRLKLPTYVNEVELNIDQKNKELECIYHLTCEIEDRKEFKVECVKYAKSVLREYFWEYDIKLRLRVTYKKNGKKDDEKE